MGERDTNGDAIAERRAFVQRLDAHEAVQRVDFTRDGFRTILVDLEPEAAFRDQWRRTATRLGYTVEQVGTDAAWPGWPADAWTLQLGSPERATWRTTIRRAVSWGRTIIDRLFGRSKRSAPTRRVH